MEILVKAAWAVIAAVHLAPAAALFSPGAFERLYGIAPGGDLGVLMTHRAALFLALVTLSVFAVFDPAVRRAATMVVSISVIGFLTVYARAGLPKGALRTIAVTDLVALVPLGIVLDAAWFGKAA